MPEANDIPITAGMGHALFTAIRRRGRQDGSDNGRVSAKAITIKKGKQPHPRTSAKMAKLTACVPFFPEFESVQSFFSIANHENIFSTRVGGGHPSNQPDIQILYFQSHVAREWGPVAAGALLILWN